MKSVDATLLVTLTGPDRPGVTSEFFSALAGHNLSVVDVEQVVIRGQLVLGVLLAGERDSDLTAARRDLSAVATQLGMDVKIEEGSGDLPRRRGQLHVTVLGNPLAPAAIAAIATQIASSGANIDRIDRLADRPITCIEMQVTGADPDALRESLTRESADHGFDVAVQLGGLRRRAMRLIVMDVDSTLIVGETIDLLAARAGCADKVAEITASAMRGEIEFATSLRERVAMLAGLHESIVEDVWRNLQLAPGARTLVQTLRRLGYRCGIVSGGFTQITDRLSNEFNFDYSAANTLEIVNGRLTGRLHEPIMDRKGKAMALRRFAVQAKVPLSQTVAIGDGANDLEMIAASGLGVAFNAKKIVRDAADTSVNVPYIDTVLYLLGIPKDEVDVPVADGQ